MTDQMKVGRLALREEGDNWVAYYAMPTSMVDAIPLGSVRISAVRKPERKAAFIALMRDIVADAIEEKTGVRPTWGGLEAAPEIERAGRA